MKSREILILFDQYLYDRGLQLDAIVIGGAAMNLLEIVSRTTKDCDILSPEIPSAVLMASREFAAALRTAGETLQDDWLNNGPASLADHLQPQWEERLQKGFEGNALRLRCLGRSDLLCSKLFALCDRGIDLGDCLALKPAADELTAILPWLEQQDAHPHWPTHVQATFVDLARRLGHGV